MSRKCVLVCAIFFTGIFLSCSGNSDKSPRHSDVSNVSTAILPKYFYKRLEGTIDNKYRIVMNLVRADTAIEGNYYYVKNGNPITFSIKSNIDKNNNITIEESKGFDMDYNQFITGIFIGKFISENEFKGEWHKPESDKFLNFDLLEKYPEGSAQFDIRNYYKKAVQKDSTKKGTAEINIMYPVIKGLKDKNIQDKINLFLTNSLLKINSGIEKSVEYKNYDLMISDFLRRYDEENKQSVQNKLERDIFFSNIYWIKILNNSDNIISFKQTVSTFEGGAHPNTIFLFKNFDLRTGKEIKLNEIFKENYLSRLTKIAENQFRIKFDIPAGKNLEEAGFWFPKGIFKLNNNFSLNESSITFQFNPYEVAAYSFGAPEITIPYSEIKELINPEGIIEQFVK